MEDKLYTLYSYCSITLYDALKQVPDLLSNLTMKTTEQTNMFLETFKSMYNLYDIAGETIPLFKLMIENRFNLKKTYYQKLIDEYEKEFDYMEGIVENETISDTTNDTGTSNSTSTSGDNDTIYDLPYKQTNTTYATKKLENSRNSDLTNTSESNKQKDITRTKSGGVNTLEQKIKFLKYIRNIYEEFCKEFRDCFAIIYG